jgi:hypothetical protein
MATLFQDKNERHKKPGLREKAGFLGNQFFPIRRQMLRLMTR